MLPQVLLIEFELLAHLAPTSQCLSPDIFDSFRARHGKT